MRKVNKHPQRSKNDYEKLRGKNRELVKEVKRLKRLKARMPEQDDDMESNPEDRMEADPEGLNLKCPKCGERNTNILEMGHKDYLICHNVKCNFRGPLK